MNICDHDTEPEPAVQTTLNAIFFSMELSRSSWMITSISPGGGERMSRHVLRAGDVAGLMDRLSQLREKARKRTGSEYPFVAVQEAGLDGFWIHRVLEQHGIESHVVDSASIATSRRRRRIKTDRMDGEMLLRALLSYKRGDPRFCAMVRPPSPEEEDRRQNSRERKALVVERVKIVNRIKGLLFCQGVVGFEPLKRYRRKRFEEIRTGDGQPLRPHLKAEIERMLDRIELILAQMKAIEATRDELVASAPVDQDMPVTAASLMQLKGIGPDFAEVLWAEGLYRHFDNRRQLASYAGLTPTPWQSGSISREQGVSMAGNPRLRTVMVQISWFWLLHQPTSALSRWFQERVKLDGENPLSLHLPASC